MSYNFRSAENKGQNNVFTKLQKNLGHGLMGFGCAGHISHNIVLAASEILHLDVEMIMSKYICASNLTQSELIP
jgi:hypothetical protein